LPPELLVAVGGAIGSVARFKLSQWAGHLGAAWAFPVGTFAVNVLGCAAIGALARLSLQTNVITPDLRAFLFVGLLGGFTTFSAFGLETVSLVRQGELAVAASYVLLSVALGLGTIWLCLPGASAAVR
jgi:fluoride exporter